MHFLIVLVTRNGKQTPVVAVLPEGYTYEQILQTLDLEWIQPEDGFEITYRDLGLVDQTVLDESDIASFDVFFPKGWRHNY